MDDKKIQAAVMGAAAVVMTVITLVMDDDDNFENHVSKEPPRRTHKRRRCFDNDDKYATLLTQLEEMTSRIKGSRNVDYSKLYDEVMKADGYDEVTFGSVFDYLVENEKIGKAFMVKSAISESVN